MYTKKKHFFFHKIVHMSVYVSDDNSLNWTSYTYQFRIIVGVDRNQLLTTRKQSKPLMMSKLARLKLKPCNHYARNTHTHLVEIYKNGEDCQVHLKDFLIPFVFSFFFGCFYLFFLIHGYVCGTDCILFNIFLCKY